MSQATAFLTSARGDMVRGHTKLESLRRAMRLDPVAAVGAVDKPSMSATAQAQ